MEDLLLKDSKYEHINMRARLRRPALVYGIPTPDSSRFSILDDDSLNPNEVASFRDKVDRGCCTRKNEEVEREHQLRRVRKQKRKRVHRKTHLDGPSQRSSSSSSSLRQDDTPFSSSSIQSSSSCSSS